MKKIIIICFAIYAYSSISAQSDSTNTTNKTPIADRLFFGGDLGLLFGTTTLIDISPIIGIKVTESVSVGGGPIFQYYGFKTQSGNFSTTTYGGRGLGRYYFSDQFFAHVEYQQLSLESINQFNNTIRRVSVPVGLIGGGYIQPIGGNTYINIQILFDVINDINAPYASPILRGGIIINPF
jgi:hypothetical protein